MQPHDRYFDVHKGQEVWLSEMKEGVHAAKVLLDDGRWVGQPALPEFHEPAGDILVFDPKMLGKGEHNGSRS